LLYTHLDDAAIGAGAGTYSLVSQHLSGWFTDQRRWLDALYQAWVADPEHGADNLAALQSTVADALVAGEAALLPLAEKADDLVGAGCREALAAAVSATRTRMTGLGITSEES
jgi:phenol hydroxylase P1 protein